MNTVKSFWIGWGSLIVAGGGAYYFAKRQINADRREKHLRRQQLQQQQYNMLYPENDPAGHPSTESSNDPAPARQGPQTDQQEISEKSKYEASAVYKRPKGDRLG
ncbi:hypothetical protein C7212DRAFT_315752 [Tuber magnatum]|uniref:Uncharacterized protein n=1 Tax=Tuber magnatum TaxID=42249 RepID=A0A317SVL1_9PEZI|nr:hypothetical protein C7212DRAFT_315752 [Tuber magnatum]